MKKINQKGFTHHLVLFGILALVLGVMGFAGYRVYQNRNIDARAASYPIYNAGDGGTLRACRTDRSIKLLAYHPRNTNSDRHYGFSVTQSVRTVSANIASTSILIGKGGGFVTRTLSFDTTKPNLHWGASTATSQRGVYIGGGNISAITRC